MRGGKLYIGGVTSDVAIVSTSHAQEPLIIITYVHLYENPLTSNNIAKEKSQELVAPELDHIQNGHTSGRA
jgi:hypothetical protein